MTAPSPLPAPTDAPAATGADRRDDPAVLDSIVIGAGQAGLAASYHLRRLGIEHVVLDADDGPGGAWRHRWGALTMRDVHGVADLPGEPAPPRTDEPANRAVPAYFGAYEAEHALPVVRPVAVDRVTDEDGILVVRAGDRVWRARTLVNATGTWTRPFVPFYPGIGTFAGEQFHTATYPGVEHLRGRRIVVVGGGASAVQFLGQLAPVAETVWVTRREPVWRISGTGEFDGLAAVTEVEERVVAGLAPRSVVSVTGLGLRPQEEEARRLGAYDHRLPMFDRIEPHGVRWDAGVALGADGVDGAGAGDRPGIGPEGRFERADVILWATGFRPATEHLAPLHLRSPQGGIALRRVKGNVQGAVTSAVDERVQLVGYGPSASTIGASRAGRQAALAVRRHLRG